MFERRSELEKLVAVAEAGKIVAAADRLAMTQPALTRAIARLESRFGAPLFERLATGVRPTALGATVAEQARRLLRAFEDAEDRIGGALAGRSGRIRATADGLWMQAVMPEAVGRFPDEAALLIVGACGACSADVVLNILARQREPAPPASIPTPEGLRLRHQPVADCRRYDRLRGAGHGAS